MIWTVVSVCALLLALVPCGLFVVNLRGYRRLPAGCIGSTAISVLIPARNESANIGAALESVLGANGLDLEVIVLDDNSDDDTATIVRGFAARDARVRLLVGEPLPAGWCGKNFACDQLAKAARHSLFLFMDADVRVSRTDALARVARFMETSRAALVSGIPGQETGTAIEKLIIPLVHFILLGFLPLRRMRATTDPRFAAACGQVLAVDRAAYQLAGGHAAVRERIHDAVALARSFRRQGLATDLFDATDTFRCRMYSNAAEVWNGFAKNAHEGLAARPLIVPATVVLLFGQVVPFALLIGCTGAPRLIAAMAAGAVLLPRLIASSRFQQPLWFAFLQPISIVLLVGIQWYSVVCRVRGQRLSWKSRAVFASETASSPPPR